MSDPGRIVVAGDWHGNALWAMAAISDAARLLADEPQRLILHLGDFGVWPGPPGQRYAGAVRRACEEAGVIVKFLHGNHDWPGGLHRFRSEGREGRPGAHWLPAGARWTWHGREWLALGGAASVDKAARHEGVSWWPEEEITEEQAREVTEAGRADVMVTHDCPAGVRHSYPPRMPSFWNMARSEAHQALLQGVVDAVQPRWLMHGHLHRAYQRECNFGYGPVEVTGLDCDGGKGLGVNYLVLDVRTMTWESPAQ